MRGKDLVEVVRLRTKLFVIGDIYALRKTDRSSVLSAIQSATLTLPRFENSRNVEMTALRSAAAHRSLLTHMPPIPIAPNRSFVPIVPSLR